MVNNYMFKINRNKINTTIVLIFDETSDNIIDSIHIIHTQSKIIRITENPPLLINTILKLQLRGIKFISLLISLYTFL